MNPPGPETTPETPAPPAVKWNASQLKSSYVNFANANSTQEEVVLNFGINNNWDRQVGEVEIELAHRIVMSPFAAKRLAELLVKLVSQYEARYGALDSAPGRAGKGTTA
jgi:spore germination protein YaaH